VQSDAGYATARSRQGEHSEHAHGVSADADTGYLVIALTLLAGFMVTEVVVAVVSGSLALLSDVGHMLSDVGAIRASIWAIRLAARPARGAWTFGWKRAELLSAAGNGITLLVVSGIVAFEAMRRLINPPSVEGAPVLFVALVGVAAAREARGRARAHAPERGRSAVPARHYQRLLRRRLQMRALPRRLREIPG